MESSKARDRSCVACFLSSNLLLWKPASQSQDSRPCFSRINVHRPQEHFMSAHLAAPTPWTITWHPPGLTASPPHCPTARTLWSTQMTDSATRKPRNFLCVSVLFKDLPRNSPDGPVVRTRCFHCRGPSSIPGRGTKIPQATQCGHPLKKTELPNSSNSARSLNFYISRLQAQVQHKSWSPLNHWPPRVRKGTGIIQVHRQTHIFLLELKEPHTCQICVSMLFCVSSGDSEFPETGMINGKKHWITIPCRYP